MKLKSLLGSCLLMLTASVATASPIFYQATDITDTTTGEDLWRYDYFIANNTGIDIDAFLIYFDINDYDFNLVSTPLGDEVDTNDYSFGADWDGVVAPDDPFLFEDGALEIYQLVGATGAITIADAVANIAASVTFIWRGQDTPGAQSFDYFSAADPFGDPAGSGLTQLFVPPPVDVPEPATSLLLGAGLLVLLRNRKRHLRS